MTDREKVLMGLAACVPMTDEDAEIGCGGCPYGERCEQDILLPVRMVEDIRRVLSEDAIPMDWLDAQIRGYASRLMSTELKALTMVKGMWVNRGQGTKGTGYREHGTGGV